MSDFNIIVKFIRKLYNENEHFIPLHEPRFFGNEKKYLNECIDSTFVSSVGKFVTRFEEMIAEYTGSKYAVAAVNGTAALHIALMLCGVKRDDEVITQSLTFIATANAITYCGAKPVFLDVDKDTLGLSPYALEVWLQNNVELRTPQVIPYNKTTGCKISACVPMHTFGHPCRIDEIKKICDKYNIALVEDAAESLGSYYTPHTINIDNTLHNNLNNLQHTGTFGKMSILSFNGNKTITTGGGGMILTDDKELAKKAKHLTTTAKVPHKWEYIHDYIGYNYRLTNLAAALGVAQMEQLPKFIENKRKIATKYKTFFRDINIDFLTEPERAKSNYWLNSIILKNREERDDFLQFTNGKGVMTRPIWELMNRLTMFKNCQTGGLPNAEWLSDRVVNIPSSIIL